LALQCKPAMGPLPFSGTSGTRNPPALNSREACLVEYDGRASSRRQGGEADQTPVHLPEWAGDYDWGSNGTSSVLERLGTRAGSAGCFQACRRRGRRCAEITQYDRDSRLLSHSGSEATRLTPSIDAVIANHQRSLRRLPLVLPGSGCTGTPPCATPLPSCLALHCCSRSRPEGYFPPSACRHG
jgi:hypothetical protein